MLSQLAIIAVVALAATPEVLAARKVSRGQVDINALRARVRRQMEPGFRPSRVKRQSSSAAAQTVFCNYAGVTPDNNLVFPSLTPMYIANTPAAVTAVANAPNANPAGGAGTTLAAPAGSWFISTTPMTMANTNGFVNATGYANISAAVGSADPLAVLSVSTLPASSASTGSSSMFPTSPNDPTSPSSTASGPFVYLSSGADVGTIANQYPLVTKTSAGAPAPVFPLFAEPSGGLFGAFTGPAYYLDTPFRVSTTSGVKYFYVTTPTNPISGQTGRLFFEPAIAAPVAGAAPAFLSGNTRVNFYCTNQS